MAYEVIGLRDFGGKARGLQWIEAHLVGRADEFAVGSAAVDAVLRGTGGILFVTGEAGMGKSRLLSEFRDLVERSGAGGGRQRWLEGRCISYGTTLPYWPFQDLLRDWVDASPGQPEPELGRALRWQLERLCAGSADEIYPFLGTMLGTALESNAREHVSQLSPEALQHRTSEAIASLFQRMAEAGPLAVAFDDLHWADASSIDLIEHLFSVTKTAPCCW